MLNNQQFLEVIRESFRIYLEKDSSRSPEKLKVLHGQIAKDLQEMFGPEYSIRSQGIGNGKEYSVDGKYYSKKVDITVLKNKKPVAGYAVKFVMRNYSQNSNNYFENMLGETANIRMNDIPYFQIFIVFDKVPYYKRKGEFGRYDTVTVHNLQKYFALSNDKPEQYPHIPDKTLLVLLNLKEKAPDYKFEDSKDYADYYKSVIGDADLLRYSTKISDTFSDAVILNNYEDFIKSTHALTDENVNR